MFLLDYDYYYYVWFFTCAHTQIFFHLSPWLAADDGKVSHVFFTRRMMRKEKLSLDSHTKENIYKSLYEHYQYILQISVIRKSFKNIWKNFFF